MGRSRELFPWLLWAWEGAGHTLTGPVPFSAVRSSSCPGHLLKLGTRLPSSVWKVTEEDPDQPMGKKKTHTLFQGRTKGGCDSSSSSLGAGDVTHVIRNEALHLTVSIGMVH